MQGYGSQTDVGVAAGLKYLGKVIGVTCLAESSDVLLLVHNRSPNQQTLVALVNCSHHHRSQTRFTHGNLPQTEAFTAYRPVQGGGCTTDPVHEGQAVVSQGAISAIPLSLQSSYFGVATLGEPWS